MFSMFDSDMSLNGAIMNSIFLIVTTGLAGFKFSMLVKITGSLWMAMADHFFNNTVINVLHIVSNNGADQMQVIHI